MLLHYSAIVDVGVSIKQKYHFNDDYADLLIIEINSKPIIGYVMI